MRWIGNVWLALNCLLLLAPSSVNAQSPILFPREQWGRITLTPSQSLGDPGQGVMETLGHQIERFEPVNRLRADDPYRVLGRAVGRLDMRVPKGIRTCTATLIDADKIITNHHCVPGNDGPVEAAQLVLGYLDLTGSGAERFPVEVTPLETNQQLDYTILRVAGSPGQKYGVVRRTQREIREAESLFILHHPGGQPLRLTRAYCRAHPSAPRDGSIVRHQCDTLGGSSGSLIFAQTDGAVVGLHHSGGLLPGDGQSFNRGTDVMALRSRSAALQAAGAGRVTAPALAPPVATPKPISTAPAVTPPSTRQAGPSFDCTSSKRPDEVAICSSAELAALDRSLTTVYGATVARLTGDALTAVRSTQSRWIEQRKGCGTNFSCIKSAYEARIAELSRAPGSQPPATPSQDVRRVPANASDGIVNMRAGPGLEHAIVVAIPAGSGGVAVERCLTQLTGTKFPWCKVTWQGRTGWVSSGGLTK